MPRIEIPFNGGTTESESVVISNQRSVNWYPTAEGLGAKTKLSLRPTPGMKKLFNAGLGPVRSKGIKFNGKAYFISNNKLIEIDSGITSGTEVGTLNTSSGRCVMAASPTELLIVDGTDGYRWDGGTFSTISDPDFPAATHIAWLDFYFIANNSGSGKFNISNLNDGTAWDALDFATVESSPDDILAIHTTLNEIWFFGDDTVEVYYNSGNNLFAFDPIPHGILAFGIGAAFSVAENEAGEVTWLASTNDVVKARVGSFTIVSDTDMGWNIDSQAKTDDAYAWTYTQAAHTFYVLTLPTADKTLVYDMRENFWHDRKGFEIGRHRASGHIYFNGKHVVGDYANSKFYELDLDTRTDDGTTIERIRRGVIISKDRINLECSRFEIAFEPGVGTVTGQGVDPQAMLKYTYNGFEWSSEIWRPIGKIGEYNNRTVWDGLGSGEQLQFEVKVTDPVKAVLVGAYADLHLGTG